jgi:hypothetical protein
MKRIVKSNYTQSTTAYLVYTDTVKMFHLGFEHDHITTVFWNEGDNSLTWDENGELLNPPEEFVLDYKENIFETGRNIGHIIPAITLEEAVNFFRTEYNVYLIACPLIRVSSGNEETGEEKGYYAEGSYIWKFNRFNDDNKLFDMLQSNNAFGGMETYSSYQAALEAGIRELIREITNENEQELPFEPLDDNLDLDDLPF